MTMTKRSPLAIGDKLGALTVIGIGKIVRGSVSSLGSGGIIRLLCECGRERRDSPSNARAMRFCGNDCPIKRRRTKIGNRFTHARASARTRGIDFALTLQDVAALDDDCNYCGGELSKQGSGIDRCDSSRGYVPGNVISCCAMCNTAKAQWFSREEFEAAMAVRLAKTGRGKAWTSDRSAKLCSVSS